MLFLPDDVIRSCVCGTWIIRLKKKASNIVIGQ